MRWRAEVVLIEKDVGKNVAAQFVMQKESERIAVKAAAFYTQKSGALEVWVTIMRSRPREVENASRTAPGKEGPTCPELRTVLGYSSPTSSTAAFTISC
jgi:hypothetical protein